MTLSRCWALAAKGGSAHVLASFCVSAPQFQTASQISKSRELAEARQEFSRQSWLASVLHHKFGSAQTFVCSLPLRKKLESVTWILCISHKKNELSAHVEVGLASDIRSPITSGFAALAKLRKRRVAGVTCDPPLHAHGTSSPTFTNRVN